MRKFFNMIIAALVIMGAAACTNSDYITEVNTPAEGISFYADAAMTRVDLAYDEDAKVWNTVWEGNETLVVVDTQAQTSYEFTNTEAQPNLFSCTTAGAEELVGKSVTISRVPENWSTLGKDGIFFSEDVVFDNTKPIKLTARNSFLRYNYQGEGSVTITCTLTESAEATSFFANDTQSTSVTFEGKGEKWVAIAAPAIGAEATLTITIDDVEAGKTTFTLERGKIYNLGTLAIKSEVCLVPGVWAADNARFAVYETATERWTDMTAVEGKFGLYSAKVATSDIVFVRMSPTDSANVWENKWNQTADLVVPTDEKNCYYITGWGTEEQPNSPGEWKAYVNIEWAVGGTFTEDNWKSEKKMTLVSTSVYKLADLTLKAYDEFKIKSAGSWDTNYGVSSFSFFTPGHWQSAVLNGGNICVDAAGTYDIYFDQEELRIYVVAADSDYTAATEQTVEGTAPEVEGDAKYLYLKPNSNWLVDNARFAAYFFDNGERWVSMTDSDGDGIYEVVVPADKNFPKVIFCRMNPNAAANNWSNKWNQTDDLTIPTNGNNLYTVKDGTWDKGGGTWSVK